MVECRYSGGLFLVIKTEYVAVAEQARPCRPSLFISKMKDVHVHVHVGEELHVYIW